jgi:hypothetical protein
MAASSADKFVLGLRGSPSASLCQRDCGRTARAVVILGSGYNLVCLEDWREVRRRLRSGGDVGSLAATGPDGIWRLVDQGWDPDVDGLPETDAHWSWAVRGLPVPDWDDLPPPIPAGTPGPTAKVWSVRLRREADGVLVGREVHVTATNKADAERLALASASSADGDVRYEVVPQGASYRVVSAANVTVS